MLQRLGGILSTPPPPYDSQRPVADFVGQRTNRNLLSHKRQKRIQRVCLEAERYPAQIDTLEIQNGTIESPRKFGV
jgi:hypothetical protein